MYIVEFDNGSIFMSVCNVDVDILTVGNLDVDKRRT
jgi:hypothetical protein